MAFRQLCRFGCQRHLRRDIFSSPSSSSSSSSSRRLATVPIRHYGAQGRVVRPEERGNALFGVLLIGAAGGGYGYMEMKHWEEMDAWRYEFAEKCPCGFKDICPLPELPRPPRSEWTDLPVRPCVCAKETCLNCRCRTPCEWEELLADLEREERERKISFKLKRFYCWAYGLMGGDAEEARARMFPEMQKPTPPSLTPPPDTNTANWMREKWNQAKSAPSPSSSAAAATTAVTSRAQKPAAIMPPPDPSSVGWMQDAWNNLKSKATSAMTSTTATQEDDNGGGADKTEAAKPKRDSSPQSQNSNRNYVVPKGGAAAAPGRGNSDATPQLDHIQHPKTYTPPSYYTKRPEDIEAENSKTPPLQHYRPATTYTPSSRYSQQPPAEDKQPPLEHFPDPSSTTYVPSHYYQHAYGNKKEVEEAPTRRGSSPEKAPSSSSASSPQQSQPQQQKPNSSYFTNGPRFSHAEPAIHYFKMDSPAPPVENMSPTESLVEKPPATASPWKYFTQKKTAAPPPPPTQPAAAADVAQDPYHAAARAPSFAPAASRNSPPSLAAAPASKCPQKNEQPKLFQDCPSHPFTPPIIPSLPMCDNMDSVPALPPPPPCCSLPPPPPPPPPPPVPFQKLEPSPPPLPVTPTFAAELSTPPMLPKTDETISKIPSLPCLPEKLGPVSMKKCDEDQPAKCNDSRNNVDDSGNNDVVSVDINAQSTDERALRSYYSGSIPAIPALPVLPSVPAPLAPMPAPPHLRGDAPTTTTTPQTTTPSIRAGLIDSSPYESNNPADLSEPTKKKRRKRKKSASPNPNMNENNEGADVSLGGSSAASPITAPLVSTNDAATVR